MIRCYFNQITCRLSYYRYLLYLNVISSHGYHKTIDSSIVILTNVDKSNLIDMQIVYFNQFDIEMSYFNII